MTHFIKKMSNGENFNIMILNHEGLEIDQPEADFFNLQAKQNELVIGNLMVTIQDNKMYAYSVWVHPEFKRKKVATILYDLAEELGKQKIYPYEYLNLEAITSDEAVEFWRKRGLNLSGGNKFFDL